MLSNKEKQKSLKRRFLFILGVLVVVCLMTMGLMVIFWSAMPLNMTTTQKRIFGGVILLYALIRIPRLFKKDIDEE